jgi:CRP/FNR family transcriptional regulator, cyclic AMP receptor protein
MAVSDSVSHLRSVQLFAGLGDAGLERLASVATEVDFPEGAVLIECDEPGSGLFVILEGTVKVELPLRDVEYGAGEPVGELSLLTDRVSRSARVLAATDVRCLAINRSDFFELIESEPKLAVALLGVLARRLLAATDGVRPRTAWM